MNCPRARASAELRAAAGPRASACRTYWMVRRAAKDSSTDSTPLPPSLTTRTSKSRKVWAARLSSARVRNQGRSRGRRLRWRRAHRRLQLGGRHQQQVAQAGQARAPIGIGQDRRQRQYRGHRAPEGGPPGAVQVVVDDQHLDGRALAVGARERRLDGADGVGQGNVAGQVVSQAQTHVGAPDQQRSKVAGQRIQVGGLVIAGPGQKPVGGAGRQRRGVAGHADTEAKQGAGRRRWRPRRPQSGGRSGAAASDS